MNRTELIAVVEKKTGLKKKIAEKAVRALLAEMAATVANGEKVKLVGFGTFTTRSREARNSRNPRTGEAIKAAAVTVPVFKAGKGFKKAVAGKNKK